LSAGLSFLMASLSCVGSAVQAASCGGDFATWRAGRTDKARASGISDASIALLDDIKPNPEVLALDRSQSVETQDRIARS